MNLFYLRICIFFIFTIPACLEDLNFLKVRRQWTSLLYLIFFYLHFFLSTNEQILSLFGLSYAFIAFTLSNFFCYLSNKPKIGRADLRMAGLIGLIGGPLFFIKVLISAIVINIPFLKKHTAFPFIPSLVFSTFFVIITDGLL